MKVLFRLIASVGFMFLVACNNGGTEATNLNPPTSPAANTQTATPETTAKTEHPKQSQGGQVIESGPYHLELVPISEKNGIHLDFYLQKGDNHETIPNAKVMAQVQMPNGEQKIFNMDYDTAGKHYAVFLPAVAKGEYKVVVLSDIQGEKVNGRFSFNR